MFRYLLAIKSQQDLALIHILIHLCLWVQKRTAVNGKERGRGTSWQRTFFMLTFMTIAISFICDVEQLKPAAYDPHCAPAHLVSHANLPLASIQVCGSNPLRDEGILCEKVLKENSVKTRLRV